MVLEKLSADIQQYHPLITGHFIEFDIYTLSCNFYRADMHESSSLDRLIRFLGILDELAVT